MSLLQELQACTKCEGLAKNRKLIVTAEGPFPSDIMFLGSSPKDREEIQGRPFSGISGKFLRATVQSVYDGHYRISYMCSILCRTPKREASDEEITNCRDNVLRQIEVYTPKVIVALGKTAQSVVLGCPLSETSHSSVGTLQSMRVKDKSVPVIITFDPQQVLKDRINLESIFIRHLRAATKLTFTV
jgi:DNA polymerase